jgi:hypothetical protein
MQPGVPIEDRPAHVQHGLDHRREDKVRVLDELAHARIVATATDGPDKQSVGSERAANVVLDVDQFALEKLAVGQKARASSASRYSLHDMDGAEPTQPHHLCNTARIVSVGFIAHRKREEIRILLKSWFAAPHSAASMVM